MKSIILKKIWPYVLAIVIFIIIAYAYTPEVLSGKVVNQSDISSWQGMSNEIVTYNDNHPGERALWTNAMFGGMPATSISVIYKGDFTQYLYDLFFTGERPASYLLISLIGGFLLCLAFGANIYLAVLGGIAITFCSYNMQIIQVGHNSKMVAIAFMPWVLASVVYAFRKRAWIGALLFAFALSFQIKANHPQITYYLAIIIVGYGIWQLCAAIKEKRLPKFFKTAIMLLIAGLIGIATNTNHLWPTYEYAEHTMRGGSELSSGKASNTTAISTETGKKTRKSRKGLDLDYATAWSYGINETPNLMIPDFNGGSSVGELGEKSETYAAITSSGYDASQIIKQLPLYWGPQPMTAGPMYMGAISLFLFILGFFVLKGGLKWWIGGVSLLSLLLAWGYHLMFVSEFFYNWAPLYNKFRTVSMILVTLQLLIPIMGIMVLNNLLFKPQTNPAEIKRIKRGFYISLGITGGFCLLFGLLPSLAGDFVSPSDSQMPEQIAAALVADRQGLLSSDAFRTLIFILLGAAVIWAGYKGKLKPIAAVLLLTLLVFIDLWSVDKRYLNDSHFVSKREFATVLSERPVDKIILQDKEPDYRVLDLSVNTFNDAYVSYHHKTIGGYSPVKLQRYQDIIENCITPEMMAISGELQGAKTLEEASAAIGYHPVLSMLNTKYIIINKEVPPIVNRYALGNAWFINKVVKAADADDEIAKLKTADPAHEAIFAEEFYSILGKGIQASKDSLATIALKSYSPNTMIYSYKSSVPQIALFSEIYYAPGWTATLNAVGSSTENSLHEKGLQLPVLRANYILRALSLPAGEYEITFNFAPESFSKGELYSKLASGLLIVLLLGTLGFYLFSKKKKS